LNLIIPQFNNSPLVPFLLVPPLPDVAARICDVGSKTLTCDLNGNLTKDGTTTFAWDARDPLTATTVSNSTFQYDPLGRRTKNVTSGTTTRFHYDRIQPIAVLVLMAPAPVLPLHPIGRSPPN